MVISGEISYSSTHIVMFHLLNPSLPKLTFLRKVSNGFQLIAVLAMVDAWCLPSHNHTITKRGLIEYQPILLTRSTKPSSKAIQSTF